MSTSTLGTNFFSHSGNIILFAIACFVAAAIIAISVMIAIRRRKVKVKKQSLNTGVQYQKESTFVRPRSMQLLDDFQVTDIDVTCEINGKDTAGYDPHGKTDIFFGRGLTTLTPDLN